jgi:molecular chaperone GrpE
MSEDTQVTETNQPLNDDASMHSSTAEPEAAAQVGPDAESDMLDSSTPEVSEDGITDERADDMAEPVDDGESATLPEDQPDAATETEVITRLATEAESLRLQVEERTSQCVRIAADFDNFRKRTEREKSELELRVKRDTISELLPVIDSFERARTQIKPQSEQEVNIHKSYQGVYKQLVDCLKRVGVSPMRVEGQPFDPNFHDAIMREATAEYEEGTVIEELRRGYLMGDLVLRHAMVKVAAEAEAEPTGGPEEQENSMADVDNPVTDSEMG